VRILFEVHDDMPGDVPVIYQDTDGGRTYYVRSDLTLSAALVMMSALGHP
jgi:hypothetical protein